MSLAGQRQEIVDLLSTLDGVHASLWRPRDIGPGSAWPLLDRLDAATGMVPGFAVTWSVVVVLPSDEERAAEWFDDRHEEVAETLQGFGHVETIEPDGFATDAGGIYVMILTVRREA